MPNHEPRRGLYHGIFLHHSLIIGRWVFRPASQPASSEDGGRLNFQQPLPHRLFSRSRHSPFYYYSPSALSGGQLQESVVWWANDTTHLVAAGPWLGNRVTFTKLALPKGGSMSGQRNGNRLTASLKLVAGTHTLVSRSRLKFSGARVQEKKLPSGHLVYDLNMAKEAVVKLGGEVK